MARELLSGADLKGPLLLNGSAGTTGQVPVSQGPGATPEWGDQGTSPGVPAGGSAGQTLIKASATDYDTVWSNIGRTEIDTLTSTQASSSTGLANVTKLAASMEANATYRVDCFVTFRSAANTTGLNLGFTAPAGSLPMVEIVVPITSTAAASQLRTIFPNAASTTSGNVLGTGVTAQNSDHTARISGVVVNGSTAGTFQIQFASETNGTAVTLQIGSALILTRLA